MKKLMMLTISGLLIAGIQGPAMADGKALYQTKGCAGCHGTDGKTPVTPTYPKLAGQNAAYLLQQLKDIKSGARSNGMSSIAMQPTVTSISDEELKQIADWLSKQ